MNVFLLSYNPALCASYLGDKHVVSQLKEAAQLLSTYCWETGLFADDPKNAKVLGNILKLRSENLTTFDYFLDNLNNPIPRQLGKGHSNHPCMKGVRNNPDYRSFVSHVLYHLSLEFYYRYQKRHAYDYLANYLYSLFKKERWVEVENGDNIPEAVRCIEKFPVAIPPQYQTSQHPIVMYRNYYLGEKTKFQNWNRSIFKEGPWWVVRNTEATQQDILDEEVSTIIFT